MTFREELFRQRQAIKDIAAKHGASNLRLFGSIVRGEERPESDVDLLVDMAEERGFADYLQLIEDLEGLLGRPVDLVTDRALSPYFRPYIEAEAQLF